MTNSEGWVTRTIALNGKLAQSAELVFTATARGVDQETSHDFRTIVHPARWFVGLKPKSVLVQTGDELAVDVIIFDLCGQVVPNVSLAVEVTFHDDLGTAYRIHATTIKSKPTAVEFVTHGQHSGEYRIRIVGNDSTGSQFENTARLYSVSSARMDEESYTGLVIPTQQVFMIPEKQSVCQKLSFHFSECSSSWLGRLRS